MTAHDQPSLDVLFEYGIQTEHSDIRAHVSAVNQTIYVFPTRNAIDAVFREPREERYACQRGVAGPTAIGWLVPVQAIEDVRRVKFSSWEGWTQLRDDLTTSRKGQLAVACVIGAMKRGRFPFWLDATEDERQHVQILGTDVLVFCKKKVQVKCDFHSGDKPLGTGNLYFQRAERNPLKRS
jgi:hypothetical protein